MILRLGDKARGAMTVSQVSAGRKNYFRIEIYGTKSSVTGTRNRRTRCGSGIAMSRTASW